MTSQDKAIEDWKKCITFAKNKVPQTLPTFGIIKNKNVVDIAKKCYCAMGYSH